MRAGDHHAVPAADAPAPSGGALGTAGGVRRAGRGGRGDRLRRGDERPTGALVVPGRPAVRPGDGRALHALSSHRLGGMAKAAGPEKVSFRQRLRQIGMVFSFTAKRDKWFLPLVIAATLLPLIAGTLLATFTGGWIWLVTGVMGALVAAMGV